MGEVRKQEVGKGSTYITALCTKEVSNVPLGPASDNYLTLNRCLAALAPGAEEFMEVKMTIETQGCVPIVVFRETLVYVLAVQAGVDASQALGTE
jgi:hypothetical protein